MAVKPGAWRAGASQPGENGQSDDREALAPLAAAVLQHLAAVVGGLAFAVPDLAGALLPVRAKCRLHDGEKAGDSAARNNPVSSAETPG
jgi:hypothetical protein